MVKLSRTNTGRASWTGARSTAFAAGLATAFLVGAGASALAADLTAVLSPPFAVAALAALVAGLTAGLIAGLLAAFVTVPAAGFGLALFALGRCARVAAGSGAVAGLRGMVLLHRCEGK